MKTRFCPSPTGHMHLGNARTALFSFLVALQNQGQFLIRIEDTDQERSQEMYTDQLLQDLRWLQLNWQEGPNSGGEHAPYWQSQRSAIYAQYYEQLIAQGNAYPCFCSAEALALSRKVQLSQGKAPRYDGTCRNLSPEIIAEKQAQGQKPTLRFAVPQKQTIQFHDLVKGRQRFISDEIGDFIIQRADGSPAFFFCNAIDDALMEVTHVLRGEDHLTNTPRQMMILQTLHLPIPEYGHFSLILGQDGAPLSKRNGSRSIMELRAQGYLPLALLNYLARLGHRYPTDDYRNLEQLARDFSLERVSKSPSRFDPSHLDYWQKEAVVNASDETLKAWLENDVALIPASVQDLFFETVRTNILFPKDTQFWAQCFFAPQLTFNMDAQNIIQQAGSHFFQSVIAGVQEFGVDYQAVCKFVQDNLQIKGKAFFMPLRVGLTGETHGPELEKIFKLLGKNGLLMRLEQAIKTGNNNGNL